MTTAYLLAVFRFDGCVPVFVRTEISTSEDGDGTPGQVCFVVDVAASSTFENASNLLLEYARRHPSREWALRSLVQR